MLYVHKYHLIKTKSYKYDIRNKNITIPANKTSKCSNYFIQIGLGLVHNIPNTLWNLPSYKNFKKHIKLWLLKTEANAL